MKSKPKTDYEVGYGKPPKSGQFKPGQSGNPKGGAKAPPAVEDLIASQAGKLVSVTVDGSSKSLPQLQVVVAALYRKAMSGDIKAAQVIFAGLQVAQAKGSSSEDPPLSSMELSLLKDLIEAAETGVEP